MTALSVMTVMALAGCSHVPGIYTYEGRAAAAKATAAFSAPTYVDGIWAAKVLPAVQSRSVDLPTLLDAIKADPAAAGKKYGRQSGTGSPFAYLAKGTGTVTKVDTSSSTGPVTVKVGSGASAREITIVTGPVFFGTALRDAVGIEFGQFSNQIDFADVATAMNAKVKADVVAKIDRSTLKGHVVTFSGAFEPIIPSAIQVVPATLTVAP